MLAGSGFGIGGPDSAGFNPGFEGGDFVIFQLAGGRHFAGAGVADGLYELAGSGSPGTMAAPDLPPLKRCSRESSWRPPMAASAWQE